MNMFKKLAVVAMMGIALGACSKVPAGSVGVKVHLLGGDKGVDAEPLTPGRYWIGWNEDLFIFPTFTQNYVWTKSAQEGSPTDESITFQDVSGLAINTDVGISYHISPDNVVHVFQKYREGVGEITHVFLRNMVRDAFVRESSSRNIEDIYGKGKNDFINAVNKDVRDEAKGVGITIESVYLIGNMRLPDKVVSAINAKIQATQSAEQTRNEVAQAKYEAEKTVAEAEGKGQSILAVAKAQATANKILSESLTPTLLENKWIDKWNGSQPTVTLGGNAVPLINLPAPK
jgi:regulator of protease activity HflC (stomatin/prohibitin superfamily)